MTRLLVAALVILAVGALAVALLSVRRPSRERLPPPAKPVPPRLPESWGRPDARARDFWFGIALLLAVIAAGLLVESLS